MKKSILTFTGILFGITVMLSQNISFKELLKSSTLQFDKLEMFLTKKGFEYYKSTNDALSKAYHFSYKENGVIVAYFSDWKDHNPDGEKYISLQTSKDVFDRIKKEGLNIGMSYLGKEDTHDEKGYFTLYKYGNYRIEFWVSQGTFNEGTTVYEISVSRQ